MTDDGTKMAAVRGLIDKRGFITALADTSTGRAFRSLPRMTEKGCRIIMNTTQDVAISAVVIELAESNELASMHIRSGRTEPLCKGHWHRVVAE